MADKLKVKGGFFNSYSKDGTYKELKARLDEAIAKGVKPKKYKELEATVKAYEEKYTQQTKDNLKEPGVARTDENGKVVGVNFVALADADKNDDILNTVDLVKPFNNRDKYTLEDRETTLKTCEDNYNKLKKDWKDRKKFIPPIEKGSKEEKLLKAKLSLAEEQYELVKALSNGKNVNKGRWLNTVPSHMNEVSFAEQNLENVLMGKDLGSKGLFGYGISGDPMKTASEGWKDIHEMTYVDEIGDTAEKINNFVDNGTLPFGNGNGLSGMFGNLLNGGLGSMLLPALLGGLAGFALSGFNPIGAIIGAVLALVVTSMLSGTITQGLAGSAQSSVEKNYGKNHPNALMVEAQSLGLVKMKSNGENEVLNQKGLDEFMDSKNFAKDEQGSYIFDENGCFVDSKIIPNNSTISDVYSAQINEVLNEENNGEKIIEDPIDELIPEDKVDAFRKTESEIWEVEEK